MNKARVAIFEGNENHRKMLRASFDQKSYLGHKVVAEVTSKAEAEAFLAAKKPFDVAIVGGELSAHDRNYKVARDIIKLIHNLPFNVLVVGYLDSSIPHDNIEVQYRLDHSQVWDAPAVVNSLQPLSGAKR